MNNTSELGFDSKQPEEKFTLGADSCVKSHILETRYTKSLKLDDFTNSFSPSFEQSLTREGSILPSELFEQSLFETMATPAVSQPLKLADAPVKAVQTCVEKPFKRPDFKSRDSLRYVRKYFLQIYKAQNAHIVRKRYVNCSVDDLTSTMKATLLTIFSREMISDDFVAYMIGIMGFKSPSKLRCSPQVKRGIHIFLDTVRNFSLQKLERIMKCENLRFL